MQQHRRPASRRDAREADPVGELRTRRAPRLGHRSAGRRRGAQGKTRQRGGRCAPARARPPSDMGRCDHGECRRLWRRALRGSPAPASRARARQGPFGRLGLERDRRAAPRDHPAHATRHVTRRRRRYLVLPVGRRPQREQGRGRRRHGAARHLRHRRPAPAGKRARRRGNSSAHGRYVVRGARRLRRGDADDRAGGSRLA